MNNEMVNINNTEFTLELNGDNLLLISDGGVLCLFGGLADLREEAIKCVGACSHGYRGDELDYDGDAVREYVRTNCEEYASRRFKEFVMVEG